LAKCIATQLISRQTVNKFSELKKK